MTSQGIETTKSDSEFVAFLGETLLIRGPLALVAEQCKESIDAGQSERLAIFDDQSGHIRDLDFSGSKADVLRRLELELEQPGAELAKKRGRPKLGVVSREVSLLPRHWEWLAEQRGGASAYLRRLIDQARKHESGDVRLRRAVDAAHRFMWDIASGQSNFEEVTRHLFAHRFDELDKLTVGWAPGIREQLSRYIDRARSGLEEVKAQEQ